MKDPQNKKIKAINIRVSQSLYKSLFLQSLYLTGKLLKRVSVSEVIRLCIEKSAKDWDKKEEKNGF